MMSQMQSGPRRVSSGGGLDVYTALALAGLVAMGISAALLWLAGTALADGELPFTMLS
ncbi:MAG: hypothetical protein HND57_00610 [Planctomycetes bacterium]|nr:hypothetical protein [Planctomycetota bacterium]